MPRSDGIRACGSSRLMFKVLCSYPLTPVSRLKGPQRSGEGVIFTHSQKTCTRTHYLSWSQTWGSRSPGGFMGPEAVDGQ